MADTPLKTVLRTQGNNRALKDGTVTPRGYRFDFEEIPVLVHGFRRMVRSLEFDVCEMALTTYICAKSFGKQFTALPVFPTRGFHHGAIAYNTRSGVTGPQDLEGRRVGVNRGYTVTTGVWVRAILQEEYGVDLSKVTWVLSGDEHVAEYEAPANVEPIGPDHTLEELLVDGDLAAAIGITVDHPDVAPLIAGAPDAGLAALHGSGLYPINHTVVIKDSVLDEHPDVAVAVFDAFAAAKNRYVEQLRDGAVATPDATDRMYARVLADTGADPLPYGIASNRAVIERLIRHAVDQRILAEPVDVESLFAPSTLELTA